jgi:hypothetical protein
MLAVFLELEQANSAACCRRDAHPVLALDFGDIDR